MLSLLQFTRGYRRRFGIRVVPVHGMKFVLEIARDNKIQVYEDPDLVAVLSTLEVNAEIPEDLYRAVAEVLAFVYRLNQRLMPTPPRRTP